VLLFDEPLSNLDAKLRRRVRQEIRELQQSLQLTVLYVTHDQSEALAVSDQIIVMDRGKIAQQGTPQQLYRQPASHFLADFIGDANLVEGEVVREGSTLLFRAAGVALPVRTEALSAGAATLALRPHRLRLVAPDASALVGSCKRCDYLGSHNEVLVNSPWGELLVFSDADAGTAPVAGDPIGIAFEPGDAIVLAR